MKAKLKLIVRQRAKYCCEYCIAQEKFTPDNFSGEHIVPVSKGGTDDIENLALACQRCNNLKYIFTHSLDPGTGKIVPLYNPRTDDWHAHFRWDETFTLIIGLSPTGRATVKRLELNRESLINFRTAFRILGLHPPY
jgi:5-methylcytosine-specific restriction endonuclease McrA